MGSGLMDLLKKGLSGLKRNKLISNVAGSLGSAGVPYAKTIGSIAGALGFGRKRYYRRGGALRLAGA